MVKTSISIEKSKRPAFKLLDQYKEQNQLDILCDLLKYIFIAVIVIKFSSVHAVFSCTYQTYKYILVVEKYYILMTIHNRVCF